MPGPVAKEAEAQPAAPPRARPLQNVTYLTAANVIANTCFVALLYTTRALGKGLFGDYTLVLSFVGLFGVFTDCGLNTVAIRDLAQVPRRAVEYTSNILALRTVISIVLAIIISVLARFLESPHIHTAVYVYALALIPISLNMTFGIPFQFQERMKYPALISVVASILTTVAYIFTLWSGHHVLGLVVAFTVVNIISAAVSAWFVYTRVIPPRIAIDVRSWPGLLRQGAPFFVLALLLTIYYRADMQILGFIAGLLAHGNLRCHGRVWRGIPAVDVLSAMVLGSVNAAVLPLLNRVVADSKDALARVVRMATVLSLTVAVPTALLITFLHRRRSTWLPARRTWLSACVSSADLDVPLYAPGEHLVQCPVRPPSPACRDQRLHRDRDLQHRAELLAHTALLVHGVGRVDGGLRAVELSDRLRRLAT